MNPFKILNFVTNYTKEVYRSFVEVPWVLSNNLNKCLTKGK